MLLNRKQYFAALGVFFIAVFLCFLEASFSVVFFKNILLVSTLICFVFYFSVFNPQLYNVFFIFLTGLLLDFLLYYPFGFQGCVLLLASFFARFYRRGIVNLPFLAQWGAFLLVFSVVYLFISVLLFSVLGKNVSVEQFLLNYLVVSLLYPFVSAFSALINRKMGVSQ